MPETKNWPSLAGLLQTTHANAPLRLLGAPMDGGAVTPGACAQAPAVFRRTLKRIGTYDVETERDIGTSVFDAGDVDVAGMRPEDGFAPLRDAFRPLVAPPGLAVMIGGNNAVTRPGVHALGALDRVGLVTLDAHFDLRDTSAGLLNGNPVQALLDDGLPGENIIQIGIAPFANARYMHETAKRGGLTTITMAQLRRRGVHAAMEQALEQLSDRCDRIYVDFDIDIIERGLAPGAPGARPDGISTHDFFVAARLAAAWPKVVAVDLTEFDPALDVSDITALVAARWFAEVLAGFEMRPGAAL